MERQYDLVVVGTGITSAVASRCREAGWTVAVVDSRPFGGTCALRGCVPKKILVSAAEAVHAARDMAGKGVPAESLTIDWPELMRFKRALVDPTPARTEQTWAKMGIEQFHGRARFVGPATLAVGDDRLTGRRVLIAAGAMPAPLKFPGADRLATSGARASSEGAYRGRHRPHPRSASARAQCGRDHQSLRRRDPAEDFRRRPEAGALRLPDVRLRHSLHALRRAPPRFTNARVYPTKIRE